jgi:KaiC/GvpD/RAD55 family RecA-like ATPase
MQQEEDEWASTPVSPISLRKAAEERREKYGEARAFADAGAAVQEPYNFEFSKVHDLKRIPSSIFKSGYAAGSIIGLIGPPGTGKTRFALQESMMSGADCFYIYNESVRPKFDNYIRRVALDLKIDNDYDLKRIKFWDTSKNQLASAKYDDMESVAERIWIEHIRKWLASAKDPMFITFDSFSNIARRHIPQMPIAFQFFTHPLTELYKEMDVEPVTFMVQQKSLSPREANTDAVVGGYGINHELDMEIVLKLHDVDRWTSDRYGWPEGTMQHSLQITKDRYNIAEYNESMIYLKDGKLTLDETISSRVEKRLKQKESMKQAGPAIYTGDVGWPE